MVTGFAPPKAEQLQIAGILPQRGVQLGFGDAQLPHYVERYLVAKREYLDAHAERKKELRKEIGQLKTELKRWPRKGVTTITGFDWLTEFLEVFINGGFDVVLANPPYVRQELIKELKPTLQKVYPSVYSGMADLYCYFYARAAQLLQTGGMLVFISSNKWFRANYGVNLRKFISETCYVSSITDFGDLPVFESATAYPMIFIAQKGAGQGRPTLFTQVKSLQAPYPDVLKIVRKDGQALSSDAMSGKNWLLTDAASATRVRQMGNTGIPLDRYVNGHIYYGVKTGLNAAFLITTAQRSDLIAADPKSIELIKPLTLGNDIRRWTVNYQDRWLIYCPWDVGIDKYPAIKSHLAQWKTQLQARPECKAGRYNWWCLARYGAEYVGDFEKAKLVFPDIAKEPRFAFDQEGTFLGNTVYMIPVADLFLLGVLNSSSVERFYLELSSQVRGGYMRFIRQYVEQIPIPNASPADRSTISALVQKCLDAKGVNTQQWEQEINERVARLYGLVEE